MCNDVYAHCRKRLRMRVIWKYLERVEMLVIITMKSCSKICARNILHNDIPGLICHDMEQMQQ